MPQVETLRVSGLREFIVAADAAGGKTKYAVREALRDASKPVLVSARQRLTGGVARSPSLARTAAGLRIVVRRTGVVSVEQSLRKTTGKRPDFGALQMRRALIPALQANESEVVGQMEGAMERIVVQLAAAG